MEIYACHKKAISSLILESSPGQMTVSDWVQDQKVDPTINQVVTWMESKKLDTVNGENCVCEKGFCISMVIELYRTTMSYSWYSHQNVDWKLCMEPTMMWVT